MKSEIMLDNTSQSSLLNKPFRGGFGEVWNTYSFNPSVFIFLFSFYVKSTAIFFSNWVWRAEEQGCNFHPGLVLKEVGSSVLFSSHKSLYEDKTHIFFWPHHFPNTFHFELWKLVLTCAFGIFKFICFSLLLCCTNWLDTLLFSDSFMIILWT